MEIVNKNFKNGFVAAFQYAVKVMSYYLHLSFLETCKSYSLSPTGLKKAVHCISKWRSNYLLEEDFVKR